MILGLMLAAAVGSAPMSNDTRVDTALGELAYTVGACQRALPEQEADGVVVALTGADRADPTAEQQRNRLLFTGLFREGASSPTADTLTAADCRTMIAQLTTALHAAAAKQQTL